VFSFETNRGHKGGLKAALAVAAGLTLAGFGSHASASTSITVTNVAMNQSYLAYVGGTLAYANGLNFTVTGSPQTLFGFCIDIAHEIQLGAHTYHFTDTYGDPGNALDTNPFTGPLSDADTLRLTNLIDTGYLLHQNDPNGSVTALQTAAIQVAIWKIINPSVTITAYNGDSVSGGGKTYNQWINAYLTGAYTNLADANDRAYTLINTDSPQHQSFAVGWPVANVPEPATWALMLTGFGGLGAVLRQRRRQAVVAA